ncbi:MAG: aspartate aminotransferase family protein [Acidilobaceae archaeon]|nr:aspartate aminotransferase family protein [Acidilobaceae archaeon]
MISEEKLELLWKDLLHKQEERTRKSKAVFERAKKVLPAGVTYHTRFFSPYPVYVERAKGSRVWDVDGNEYIDLWMGHGTHILGHLPDVVLDSMKEIAGVGTHLGFENPYAVEYAELLTKVVPNVEMVRFSNSGTEANMYVVRLVRAYTGRKHLIKIEGGWHGGYDVLHTGVTPPFTGPDSAGLPEETIMYTISVPYNDLSALEGALRRYPAAAIILEPVLGAGGCIEPVEGYLKGVRELADKYGALLVLDEVITGFRLSPGGGQEYFNVDADLVVMGKIVGGGYPGAGAFGGRSEIMEMLDHLKRPDPRSRPFHGGTFTGNPVSMIAGMAMVSYLHKNRGLYERAKETWEWAKREIEGICEEHDRACWTTGTATMVGVHFTRIRPRNVREAYELRWSRRAEQALHLYSRLRGILYMSEKMPHFLPSLVHTQEEAKATVDAVREFLSLLR